MRRLRRASTWSVASTLQCAAVLGIVDVEDLVWEPLGRLLLLVLACSSGRVARGVDPDVDSARMGSGRSLSRLNASQPLQGIASGDCPRQQPLKLIWGRSARCCVVTDLRASKAVCA